MTDAHRLLGIYLHLARASQLRMQPMVRDKLLVLAGVQAESMGLAPISALCRHKVLAHNAQHMIRDWPTMESALADERFRTYLKQLERRYSTEKSEHMLASLGIELGRERELYASDLEYAAALLGTDPESIDGLLLQQRGGAVGPSRRSTRRSEQSSPQEVPADGRQSSGARSLLVTWGPFACGVVVLAIVALVVRQWKP
ncbi:MAG: hypothetical protein WD845_12605 [Pirellulales bacterium]